MTKGFLLANILFFTSVFNSINGYAYSCKYLFGYKDPLHSQDTIDLHDSLRSQFKLKHQTLLKMIAYAKEVRANYTNPPKNGVVKSPLIIDMYRRFASQGVRRVDSLLARLESPDLNEFITESRSELIRKEGLMAKQNFKLAAKSNNPALDGEYLRAAIISYVKISTQLYTKTELRFYLDNMVSYGRETPASEKNRLGEYFNQERERLEKLRDSEDDSQYLSKLNKVNRLESHLAEHTVDPKAISMILDIISQNEFSNLTFALRKLVLKLSPMIDGPTEDTMGVADIKILMEKAIKPYFEPTLRDPKQLKNLPMLTWRHPTEATIGVNQLGFGKIFSFFDGFSVIHTFANSYSSNSILWGLNHDIHFHWSKSTPSLDFASVKRGDLWLDAIERRLRAEPSIKNNLQILILLLASYFQHDAAVLKFTHSDLDLSALKYIPIDGNTKGHYLPEFLHPQLEDSRLLLEYQKQVRLLLEEEKGLR